MSQGHTGRCLCGAVAFSTGASDGGVHVCHCEQCRQWGSAPFAAVTVPLDSLTFESCEERIQWYRASDYARRGFCGACGSSLFWHADKLNDHRDEIAVSAGALKTPAGLKTTDHIFLSERGDYYQLPNDGAARKDSF